jgi:quercetin dioxygenase-like cupin family protein
MTIISATQATHFELPNVNFSGLVSPKRGSKENSLWKFVLAPKAPGTKHQLTREELILVTSGTAKVEIGGKTQMVTKGDAIIVPPHTDFSISNESDTKFEGIAVLPVGGQAVMTGEEPFTPPWAL